MSIERSKNGLERNGFASTGRLGPPTPRLWRTGRRARFHHRNGEDRPVMITGGAGFIGTNLADRLCSGGRKVLLYDNLSRAGVEKNLAWLQETHGDLVEISRSDTRDFKALQRAVARASQVFHFAAQVAVTTSLDNPIEDFEINARGALNLLEAIRAQDNPPPLIFTSTNKVYGDLGGLKLLRREKRYEPADERLRTYGFSEECPLHFHSPYGCSKGAACQYVLDYARTFGLKTAVFRMSCIYGPHQFGTEDQGWVAHFLIRAIKNQPITIYGDGRQVRDILFVEDLIDAFMLAHEHIEEISGQAFNIGGGPDRTVSLLELLDFIGELKGKKPAVRFDEWRAADQQYYVSDTRRFTAATRWVPKVNVPEGIERLYQWLRENRGAARSKILRLSALTNGSSNGKNSSSSLAKANGLSSARTARSVERKLVKAG
jgi:CDP-paratose 2-epimerase